MGPTSDSRRIRLRYRASCQVCRAAIDRGATAFWDRSTHAATCLECAAATPGAADNSLEPDSAGASAQRRHDQLHTNREARIRAAHPHLGGVILALSEDPQSTRAWERGAQGERRLAEALGRLDVVLLNDRLIPGTKANVDHIVVSAAGVFVIDAKYYRGMVEIRDKGGLFRSDRRLYVGGRDCSKLARAMARQVECVVRAMGASSTGAPVTPVLCFVDGEWPLISRTEEFEGVRLESLRSIRKLVTKAGSLSGDEMARLGSVLHAALRSA